MACLPYQLYLCILPIHLRSDRYRSVIESADSVFVMDNAVASLEKCVEGLESQLENTTWTSPEESYQSSKGEGLRIVF